MPLCFGALSRQEHVHEEGSGDGGPWGWRDGCDPCSEGSGYTEEEIRPTAIGRLWRRLGEQLGDSLRTQARVETMLRLDYMDTRSMIAASRDSPDEWLQITEVINSVRTSMPQLWSNLGVNVTQPTIPRAIADQPLGNI